jgi:hypothetical protein
MNTLKNVARALAVGCQPLLVPDYAPISSHTKCLTNRWSQPLNRRDAVVRVYDDAGNVTETREHTGEFKGDFVTRLGNHARA